jgi:hypothetical protein
MKPFDHLVNLPRRVSDGVRAKSFYKIVAADIRLTVKSMNDLES